MGIFAIHRPIHRALALCCIALCAHFQAIFAQPAPIHYAEPTPVIDGGGAEWIDKPAFDHRQANPIATNANTMQAQLAWDEQYLYLFVQVHDNVLLKLTSDSSKLYLNDAVELYIDPLDDSGDRMDINDYQFIVDYMGTAAVLKGDKSQIPDSSVVAPKDYGLATVAYQFAALLQRNDADEVTGYSVEMAIPFAGLGAKPKAGMQLKIDVCVDDLDSLSDLAQIPEGAHLPGYFSSNWEGYRDFSFPDHWRLFVLAGGPSVTTQLSRDLLPYWIYIVLGLVAMAALVIAWQAYRIRQLKDVLPRKDVQPALMQALEDIQAPAAAPDSLQQSTATPPISHEPSAEIAPAPNPAGAQMASKPLHPQIVRCRRYIFDHLDQDLKMEDLAAECAMSLRSLQRIFKDELDMSPLNFVVLIKMEHAAHLLQSGQCNVSEAAWQLGFQDGSYFSRVFKKYHGVSPKAMLR